MSPQINNPGSDDLHYALELVTDRERPRFRIDLYFRGNAEGAGKLRLPSGCDTQDKLYNTIQVVHVRYDVTQDWPGALVRRGDKTVDVTVKFAE